MCTKLAQRDRSGWGKWGRVSSRRPHTLLVSPSRSLPRRPSLAPGLGPPQLTALFFPALVQPRLTDPQTAQGLPLWKTWPHTSIWGVSFVPNSESSQHPPKREGTGPSSVFFPKPWAFLSVNSSLLTAKPVPQAFCSCPAASPPDYRAALPRKGLFPSPLNMQFQNTCSVSALGPEMKTEKRGRCSGAAG